MANESPAQGNKSFHLFGFDVLLDDECNPYLLEVTVCIVFPFFFFVPLGSVVFSLSPSLHLLLPCLSILICVCLHGGAVCVCTSLSLSPVFGVCFQINHSPSLSCDGPTDSYIKEWIVTETLMGASFEMLHDEEEEEVRRHSSKSPPVVVSICSELGVNLCTWEYCRLPT